MRVCRQLNLSWGVSPVLLNEKHEVFELFNYALEVSKKSGYLKSKDIAVITTGVPMGMSGTTNMIKVQVI